MGWREEFSAEAEIARAELEAMPPGESLAVAAMIRAMKPGKTPRQREIAMEMADRFEARARAQSSSRRG